MVQSLKLRLSDRIKNKDNYKNNKAKWRQMVKDSGMWKCIPLCCLFCRLRKWFWYPDCGNEFWDCVIDPNSVMVRSLFKEKVLIVTWCKLRKFF